MSVVSSRTRPSRALDRPVQLRDFAQSRETADASSDQIVFMLLDELRHRRIGKTNVPMSIQHENAVRCRLNEPLKIATLVCEPSVTVETHDGSDA